MKLLKQFTSLVILILIFLIGYFHPDWYLWGGFTLCFLNYIYEDNKRFQDTFTPPYLPDKPPQISLPPIKCTSIDWGLYDYKSLRKLAKHFSIPANQKKTVLIDVLEQITQ